MNDITFKYDNVEYTGNLGILAPCDKEIFTVYVGVNGDYNCNDFYIGENDEITYKRNRNIVDFIIDCNTSLDSRTIYITVFYKLNPSIYNIIEVTQESPNYSVTLSKDVSSGYSDNIEFTFDTLLNKSDSNKQEYDVYVHVDYGDWFVGEIEQYAKKSSEYDEYSRVTYDNGLKIIVDGSNRIIITNYGKSNLYYDSYYVINVKNKYNLFTGIGTITIKYNKTSDNFSFKDDD